ncbi:uncharacterized protein PODANS_7_3665 [Podospora anserina S mat+]|uniref:Podospora anserina S mat+ genomic DNA chromosome 7, supercontig 1 n=1 Tax=Podospora anserina (strain S / ATCC MYA-4624 / DSM 980 / FGSC 10383) TaxID=515849 RepID=B2AV97_PODAN|nr:uncharacterized protein PODANS_7_3665 [Podospora anserina S mat+]CAP68320.1 unnamed protein product [Podospora anserina S mat+]CDP31791.1 Putative protein of unknown function [Podospora anserina S mat+]
MKASFSSVLAALAAFNTALALPTEASASNVAKAGLPEGLPDGIYIEKLADDGSVAFERVADVNITAPAEVASLHKRQGSFGPHCDYDRAGWLDSNNRQNAINALANGCGDGWFFNAPRVLSSVNGAFAYGCNYQGDRGTTCRRNEIHNFLGQTTSHCGTTTPGWFSFGQGTVSYGYTLPNVGFC